MSNKIYRLRRQISKKTNYVTLQTITTNRIDLHMYDGEHLCSIDLSRLLNNSVLFN